MFVVSDCGVENDTGRDTLLTPKICRYIRAKKPEFLFVQLDSVDGAGHRNGYGTEKHLERIAEVDAFVGAIYGAVDAAGILEDTLFVVIADHGGTNPGNGQGGAGGKTEGDGGVDGTAHILILPRAEISGDDNAGAHSYAVEEADHHKDQAAGGADGGKGVFADVIADTPSVKGIIKLLENIAEEHGQSEQKHTLPDGAFGEGLATIQQKTLLSNGIASLYAEMGKKQERSGN